MDTMKNFEKKNKIFHHLNMLEKYQRKNILIF